MPHLRDTAYPRIKSVLKPNELAEVYTPTVAELEFCYRLAKRDRSRAHFILLLKSFQRLGYFPLLAELPTPLIAHLAAVTQTSMDVEKLREYDTSLSKRRHQVSIRKFCGISAYGDSARKVLATAVVEAARLKDDLTDIINVGIEELIRNRFELPAFSTLLRAARTARTTVNRGFFQRIHEALGKDGQLLDTLFELSTGFSKSPWDALKHEPGRPSRDHLRELLNHQAKLARLPHLPDQVALEIPENKQKQFALDGHSLDAARMMQLEPRKRAALAICLIQRQRARALDDLGDMLVKRMMKIHRNAEEALLQHQIKHREITEQLLGKFEQVVEAYQVPEQNAEAKISGIGAVLGSDPGPILEKIKAQLAFSGNNYYGFLWPYFKSYRSVLFELLSIVPWVSTSQDSSLMAAIEFLRSHGTSRTQWLELPEHFPLESLLYDRKWRKLVIGQSHYDEQRVTRVQRRPFELLIFSLLSWELKSGDIAIQGAEQFSDYRMHLLSLDECQKRLPTYATQAGIEADPKQFIASLKNGMAEEARRLDENFPKNNSIRIENGEPVLCRIKSKEESDQLKIAEEKIAAKLKDVGILDALVDSDRWLNWTRNFGPISGMDAKIENPALKYVITSFCYGSNLGPAQTARSVSGIDRRQLAWINQRHITEENLDEAITQVINGYNQFALPKLWGSGKHASADGTRWNIYEENLLSEYHIRYGGYGGIGYYHVSDTYIALFSHFIPCGVWEAVYILDGLIKNQSDIQPDILHGDTQAQSTTVFGLAHLLGIDLMPRIRNWKDLKLYRPNSSVKYMHIDSLFTDEAIDWKLIETHLPDMLQVAISIQAGRISASTILRRLGTASRKNRLYFAFRELGRAVRTRFLLRYLSSQELRSTIQGATCKSEAFNCFIKWVFFGGKGIIAENSRDAQCKIIKYNHLIANLLIFHTVHGLTYAIHELEREGFTIEAEILGQISPYLTEHINRFGDYKLDPDRETPPLESPDHGSFQYQFSALQV